MSIDLEKLSWLDVMKQSPLGLIITDREYSIKAVNPGAERILRFSASNLTGNCLSCLLTPETSENKRVEEIFPLPKERGFQKPWCMTLQRGDGSMVHVEMARSAIFNEEKEIIGCASLIRDLSAFGSEQEVRLQEKMEAIDRLIQGLAHELGTPLNLIQGHAELVISNLEKDDPNVSSLQKILSATRRITTLMKTLVLTGHQKKGKNREINVENIINDLLNFLKIQLKKNRIASIIEVSDEIPPIYCDRTQIEEVFLNIIINAIQSMEKGGELSICISTEKIYGTQYVKTVITDQGCGICSEELHRIFEPFYSKRPEKDGIGLGLYIARAILNRYGGRILVKSEKDAGTSMTVLMPAVED